MLKKPLIILIGLTILINGCSGSSISTINTANNTNIIQDNWTNYQHIKLKHWNINNQDYYAFLINPTNFQLKIIENSPDPASQKSLEEIHQQEQSLLTFNGGFYNEKFQPTGLLISEGKTLSELVKADLLNGIFLIDQNHQPALLSYDQYKKTQPSPDFAIQNGPILIDNQGQIAVADRSNKKANRTAIGLTADQQIIVIFCRNSILNQNTTPTLYQFADTVKNLPDLKDLGIHSLLNLDGGPSTSFAIKNEIYPEQLEKVENLIVVKPQNDV